LLCHNASISDFVNCAEADEVLRFLGGERLGVDPEDVSDCVAMSPLQKGRDPGRGRQPPGSRCVDQYRNAGHRYAEGAVADRGALREAAVQADCLAG
jgi:hypothetical protein